MSLILDLVPGDQTFYQRLDWIKGPSHHRPLRDGAESRLPKSRLVMEQNPRGFVSLFIESKLDRSLSIQGRPTRSKCVVQQVK